MSESAPRVRLRQQRDYQFSIEFGAGIPALLGDETPPLGQGQGPTPVQLLAAAAGNCMADSLLFALRKFKQSPEPLSCAVTAELGRNAEGRLRVQALAIELTLGVAADTLQHLERALDQFENFCTVAQSIGQGIALHVTVLDATGRRLK